MLRRNYYLHKIKFYSSRHLISRLSPPASPRGEAIFGLHCGAMLPQPHRRWDFTSRREISPCEARFHPGKAGISQTKKAPNKNHNTNPKPRHPQKINYPSVAKSNATTTSPKARFHPPKEDFTSRREISPRPKAGISQKKGSATAAQRWPCAPSASKRHTSDFTFPTASSRSFLSFPSIFP